MTAADREGIRPGGLGAAGIDGPTVVGGTADASADPGVLTGRNALAAGVVVALAALPSSHHSTAGDDGVGCGARARRLAA